VQELRRAITELGFCGVMVNGYSNVGDDDLYGARWIEAAPTSENDRRKICYDNAATLFGLRG
jgi:hypothetical protein